MKAAKNGHARIVKALLQGGASVQVKNKVSVDWPINNYTDRKMLCLCYVNGYMCNQTNLTNQDHDKMICAEPACNNCYDM